MYPDHYTVPQGLHIRLVGTVRWGASPKGHQVTTLWLDPSGNAYYCEDLWTALTVPFWITTVMSDLVQCDPNEFADHTANILALVPAAERTPLRYRYEELVYLWGTAVGSDQAIEAAARKAFGNE